MSDFNLIHNYLFQQEIILNKIQNQKEKESVVRLTLEQALETAVRDKKVDEDENRELIVFANKYKKFLPSTFKTPPKFDENNASHYIEQLLPDAYNDYFTFNRLLKGPIAPITKARVALSLRGATVNDPYIYFEDSTDLNLHTFYKAQQDYSNLILASLPGVEPLKTNLTELRENNVTKLDGINSTPSGIFFTKLKDKDGVASLFYKKNPLSEETLLFDPNKLNTKDKKYAIIATHPSPTGRYVAVKLIVNGDNTQQEMRILDLTITPPKTIDTIPKISSSATWLPDESGIVYVRHPNVIKALWQDEEAYLHILKEESKKDRILIGNKESNATYKVESDHFPSVYISPEGSHLIVALKKGSHQKIITAPISKLTSDSKVLWKEIANFNDEVIDFAQHNNDLYLFTTKNPNSNKTDNDINGMIVRVSLNVETSNINNSTIILPSSNRILNPHFAAQKDRLIVFEQKAAVALPMTISYSNTSDIQEITLPVVGNAGDNFIRNHLDPRMSGGTFLITQWGGRASVYQYSPEKQNPFTEIPLEKKPEKAVEIDSTVIKAKDAKGIEFPITILFEKGKNPELNKKNKLYVEGYGHYGSNYSPNQFSGGELRHIGLIKKGWIIAIAHVPGGGEMGEKGHQAGELKNKTNSEKSFVNAIQALHQAGYSSPNYTAADGKSAGGYLVNWVVTHEGVKLIRAFTQHSAVVTGLFLYRNGAGRANLDKFGDPHNSDQFNFVKESDPSQYIQPNTLYPDGLFLYDQQDKNVHFTHMLRGAAQLRASNPKNIAISMQTSCGHVYGGCEDSEIIEKEAYVISWLEAEMAKNK